MSNEDYSGYIVAYEQEEIQFPVYVLFVIALAFIAAAVVMQMPILMPLGLLALGFAYYNYPLLETGRPRIGAGQYGVFLEGLGIIAWGAVEGIEEGYENTRGVEHSIMLIKLRQPVERALIADWRERPIWRFMMRLPWTMPDKETVRVPLDILDRPSGDILKSFVRMMTFYRR